MKLHYKKIGTVLGLAVLLGYPLFTLTSFSSSAPADRTGSPGDGSSCVSCHSTFPVQAVSDIISTDIPQSGYVPGQTYSITVSGMEQVIAQKYGFSLTAEDASGNKLGTFTAGSNSVVSTNHIGHNPASTSGTPSWTFTWTAPVSGNGTVTLYAASVVADGTGTNQNDAVVTSNVAFDENLGTSIGSISKDDLDAYVYGNQLRINNLNGVSINNVIISNTMGQIVDQQAINNSNAQLNIEVSDLKSGIYFVVIETEIGSISKKVLK